MNKTAKKSSQQKNRFVSEMHLNQPEFTCSGCGAITKNKIRIQKLKYIPNIFIKMNQIKLVFNMIQLIKILKIQQEEQLQVKYYVVKHLIFFKTQTLMDIKEVLLLWFKNVLIKGLLKVVVLNLLLIKISVLCTQVSNNYLKHYTNILLEI